MKCLKCNDTGKVEMPHNLKMLKAFYASGASDTLHWDGVSPAELDRVDYMPCPECTKPEPPNSDLSNPRR